ncbi:MAG: hypothetical protein RR253_02200 [Oscillospiraceae bacterium]
MKKVIALALTLALGLSLVACAPKAKEPEVVAPTFKTGVGTVTTVKPVDATADKDGSFQVNTTIVVATFDQDGKVVSATLDTAQQTAKVTSKGAVNGEIDLRTKVEKGADYGMVGSSAIKKELDAQYKALTDWMVGKTVAEITGMKTMDKGDGNHTAVPDIEDLKASVTITVGDCLAAVQKAFDNAIETKGAVAKTGLGTVISAKPVDATADKNGSVQITTTIVGASFDAEGKVVAAIIDAAQQEGKFTAKGVFEGEVDLRTKVEKGPDYGMLESSGIKKEVNEQYKALGDWMAGKTVAEITGMKTMDKGDGAHTKVPDVEDLKASVTITVGEYLDALVKAEANAK